MKKYELLDKLEDMRDESQSSFIGSGESELDFRENVADLIINNYISVSSVLALIKELEEKLTSKISTQTRATILFTINELKQLIK